MIRLEGELLLASRTTLGCRPEAHFRRAIAISAEGQAKSLELRAAMSLGRLWRDQGRRAEARGLVEPVYNWFTEGFDTPDVREAKALLDELQDR